MNIAPVSRRGAAVAAALLLLSASIAHSQDRPDSNIPDNLVEVYRGHYIGKVLPTPRRAVYAEQPLTLLSETDGQARACVLVSPGAERVVRLAAAEISAQVGYVVSKHDDSVQQLLPVVTRHKDTDGYPVVIALGTTSNLPPCNVEMHITYPHPRAGGYLIRATRTAGDDARTTLLCLGHDAMGAYHAAQSLLQLIHAGKDGDVLLKSARIDDWPGFRIRSHQFDGGFPSPDVARFCLAWSAKLKISHVGFGQAYDRPMQWRSFSDPEVASINAMCNRARDIGTVRAMFYPHPHRSKDEYNIRIGSPKDMDSLVAICDKALAEGASGLMLRSDDIHPLAPEDAERFDNQGAAHAFLVNQLHKRLRAKYPGFLFLFCPPCYRGKPAEASDKWCEYLDVLGKNIPPDVHVIWTGPITRSLEIKQEDLDAFVKLVGRVPFLWDNTVYAHRSQYGYDPRNPHYMLDAFQTVYPERFPQDTLGITYNWHISGQLSLVGGINTADYLWNPEAYDPERSLRDALAVVAGPDAIDDILRFRDNYYFVFDTMTNWSMAACAERLSDAVKELNDSLLQLERKCDNKELMRELDRKRRWLASRYGATDLPLLGYAHRTSLTKIDLREDGHGWKTQTKGDWEVSFAEGILKISFPWATRSSAGALGAATTTVGLPRSPTGRYYLCFSVWDDYRAYGTPPNAWPGFLVKQVLLDGTLVWEDDVEGAEPTAQQLLQVVDVTKHVENKRQVSLTVRGVDKRGVGNMGAVIAFSRIVISSGPFDLRSTLLEVPDTPWLRPEEAFTASALFTVKSVGQRQGLFLKGGPLSYFAFLNESGHIVSGIGTRGSELSFMSAKASNVGDEVHMALTCGGGKMRLYVNGSLSAETPFDGHVQGTRGNLTVGSYGSTHQFLHGMVRDFRYYDHALSEEEVKDLAAGATTETGAVARETDIAPQGVNPARDNKEAFVSLNARNTEEAKAVLVLHGDDPKGFAVSPGQALRVRFLMRGTAEAALVDVTGSDEAGANRRAMQSSLAGKHWLGGQWKQYEGTVSVEEGVRYVRVEFRFADAPPEFDKPIRLEVRNVSMVPLPKGLAGWWRVPDPEAVSVPDLSGRGNHATVYRIWEKGK